MSGRNIMKSSVIVGAGVVALTLGACASSGSAGSRYGNVYDYESGGSSCSAGASCGAVVTPHVETVYGPANTGTIIGGQPVSPGVIYTDCSQIGHTGCAAPIYTQPVQPYISPAPVHTAPVHTGPINCPTGTTPAGDGTCMMTGGGTTYTGITHGSTHTGPTATSDGAIHCPSGTTRANDGTCLVTATAPIVTVYPTTPHTNTGYQPVDHHQAPVYRPIRK